MSHTPFTTKDLYKILEVESSATTEEIKKAFRQQSLKWHPDKAGNTPENNDKFAEIKEAYDILSDGESREGYDAYLARNFSSPEQANPSTDKSTRDSPRDSHRERHHGNHRHSHTGTGGQRSRRRHTREPDNGFNSNAPEYRNYWENLRTPHSGTRHNANSSRNTSADNKTFYRQETIRIGLAQLQPFGPHIQSNVNSLVTNHQALWEDFRYYGLVRGADADLWYSLFDATRAANIKIQEAWEDVISETRAFHEGTMRPDSGDLAWKICDIHSKALHMMIASDALREISFILSYNFRSSYPDFKDEMVWLFKSWRNTVKR